MAMHLPAASLVLLMVAPAPRAQGEGAGELAARLSAALSLRVADVRETGGPEAASCARVAELTEGDAETLRKARFYRGTFESTRPRVRGAIVLCRLPLAKGSSQVVLAVDEGRVLRGAAIVDGELAVDEAWRRLLAQFKHRPIQRAAETTTVADFERRREAAARGRDDDDRLAHALLTQRARMLGILDPFMAVVDRFRRDRTLADEELRQVIERLEGYAEVSPGLALLLEDRAEEYAALARRAAGEFRAFGEAVQAGEDPQSVIRKSQATCTSCHRLKIPGRQKRLQDAAKQLRREHGFGDGYFVLGHDVFAAGADPARAQALATEVRRAALLIDLQLAE